MVRNIVRKTLASAATAMAVFGSGATGAAVLYTNGFESNIAGWDVFGGAFNATRVASGTGGITSASGAFHATSASPNGAATNWGGYNFGAGNAVPTAFQAYSTSVDFYLDLSAGLANDTRFDFSSAVNNAAGTFLRDFVFNAGFYNDGTGPGAGTDRFIVSASNNAGRANSFPKNPGRDPFAISASGWYTFEHQFYEQGGFLAVDFNIFDAADVLQHSWTISGADAIGGVGGNRYGWIVNNEIAGLALDNSELRTDANGTVPEPASLALIGLALAGLAAVRKRKVG